MASGVTFDEDYLDFNSDINRMGRVLALGGRMDDFAAHLTETFAAPGKPGNTSPSTPMLSAWWCAARRANRWPNC